MTSAGWVALSWMSIGLLGPYSDSNTRLATIVGSANGRSMIALTNALPGNSSRTSTQAMSVPKTTLIRATTSETHTVIVSASIAASSVMASQKPLQPLSNDCTVIAASGSSTMTLSHSQATPIWAGDTPLKVRDRPRNPPGAPAPVGVCSVAMLTVALRSCRSW